MPLEEDAGSGETTRKPKVRRISGKSPAKSAVTESGRGEKEAEPAPGPEVAPKADQKRSKRRRRGKGKSAPHKDESSDPSHVPDPAVTAESVPLVTDSPQPSVPKEQPAARDLPQKPRRKLDPEKVAKNAWKIFLAEVSEEGVALIGDNDGRELARRCFRLSEIFLEEEGKRG